MNKIEFSDVNRFFASIGLISIGLAFFLPWFVNQNTSILLVEQQRLEKLTPTAQEIISKQQSTLLTINNWLSIVSIILIIIGFLLLIFGIIRWNKRQTVIDKIQDEELRAKEIQNLTINEKRSSIEKEIIKNDANIQHLTEKEMQLEIESYIQTENSIFLKLSEHFKESYKSNQNVRIGNYEYDIILKHKTLLPNHSIFRDRIVEIKFYKNISNCSIITDEATKFILSCNNYQNNLKRNVLGFMIIIYTGNAFEDELKKYKRDIQQYATDAGITLTINFFPKTKITNTKVTELLKR